MLTKTYLDTTLSIEERVVQLLSQMSVKEKVAQLWGVWTTDLITPERTFAPARARQVIPDGVGHISRVGGAGLLPPTQSAALANAIQRYLLEETRLGIPGIVHEESCAGYLARHATTFPQAIGLAATWEPELIEKMTGFIREQMRSVGAHLTLAPVLDVVRDPRWGRLEETFGEDPFLISAIGTAYIRGIQGDDLSSGIAATAKHFIGYGWSEGGLNWGPAHIPARELREIFLTPFAAAIKAGNVAAVMNAYHEMDGIPCGSSRELMVDVLRRELGFNGTVISDYFTLNMLHEYHQVAASKEEAAYLGLAAGIDVELPAADCYGEPLLRALEAGHLEIDLVDACVERVLTQKFQLGLFDQPYVETGRVAEIFADTAPVDFSQTLAQKSIVLLKNEGHLLPLAPTLRSIAVIGPSADSVRLLQGDYHYPSHLEGIFNPDQGLTAPNPQQVNKIDWMEHFPPTITVLAEIKAQVSAATHVLYAEGCSITGTDTSGFEAAVAAAKQAEVAIVVVGDKSGLAKGATTGESIDSATLELPGMQLALIQAIHATGTPVIVVLINGRPYNLTWLADHIPAMVECWLPAEQGGAAIAGVLFGAVNPGGKLPVSFPRHVGQVPVYYNHKPSGGRTHWQGDYMDMPTTPLFPFGHGLSYTQFTYANLQITPAALTAQDHIHIQLEVSNTGAAAGDEVVQLYVHDRFASVTRPVKELKGFKRLHLQPGEKRRIIFDLDVRHLGFYNREMQFVIEPGGHEVLVGSSSEDIRLHGTFQLTGDVTPVEQVFFTPVIID